MFTQRRKAAGSFFQFYLRPWKVPEMPDSDGLLTYVLGGVTAVVSALAATVGVLWRNSETRNAQAITRLETKLDSLELKQDASEKAILECEKDRSLLRGSCDFLREACSTLKSKVNELEKLVKG